MSSENYLKDIRKYVGHRPLITVGTWLLVYNDKDEILMQLRSDFSSWDFPGGTMELGETIEETAKRELKEETNLEMDDMKILDIFSGEGTYRKYPNKDELYVVSILCEVNKFHGNLKINDNESSELKWFPTNKIPTNLSPVTQNYINEIKKYLHKKKSKWFLFRLYQTSSICYNKRE